MLKTIIAATIIAAALAGQAHAQDQGIELGTLDCAIGGGTGFIFGSTKDLNCVLVRPNGTAETYSGKINRYGIDIGFTKAVHVVWHVYSLNESAPPGALAGNYIGSQGSLTISATAGGNILIGGVNQSIVLNSVVLQSANSGFNFADGIAEMTLVPVSY